MKCPNCGAENPEGADFCTLCLRKLDVIGSGNIPYRQPGTVQHGSQYVAPGEWRGDDEKLIPPTSKTAQSKIKEYRWKLAVYGLVMTALIMWLVISLTIFATASPSDRSMQLIEAINKRNPEAFSEIIMPDRRPQGEQLYRDIVSYLGEGGLYADVRFDVTQDDNYEARSYIDSGNIDGIYGSEAIDASDDLVIWLENQEGVWYVNPANSEILP